MKLLLLGRKLEKDKSTNPAHRWLGKSHAPNKNNPVLRTGLCSWGREAVL